MATILRQPSFSNLEFSFSVALKQKTLTNNNHNKSKIAEPRWRRLDNIKLGRGWGWVGGGGTTPFPNQMKIKKADGFHFRVIPSTLTGELTCLNKNRAEVRTPNL